MAEIDEAAAVERARWISNVVTNVYTKEEVNLARAALAWKARAEAWERIAIRHRASFDAETARAEAAEKDRAVMFGALGYSVQTGTPDRLSSGETPRNPLVDSVVRRAEAAEAERDTANAKLRVMESRMKQIHAALLASMSDEQLATSVKAR